jgi:hypothetical protein
MREMSLGDVWLLEFIYTTNGANLWVSCFQVDVADAGVK